MNRSRLIVVSPQLTVTTTSVVDEQAEGSAQVRSQSGRLHPGAALSARAAREQGADVLYLGLAEPQHEALLRTELEPLGIEVVVLPAAAASCLEHRFVTADDQLRYAVSEVRLPDPDDVDRLLDRLGQETSAGASFIVTAEDLTGMDKPNFVERVIGRAWGLGIRTFTSLGGASLKQAFHSQPLGSWMMENEIRKASPPDAGVEETTEESLDRIFLEPTRILLVHRNDGVLMAASREGRTELGPAGLLEPSALIGALAARLVAGGTEYLSAAQEVHERLNASHSTRAEAEPVGQQDVEAGAG